VQAALALAPDLGLRCKADEFIAAQGEGREVKAIGFGGRLLRSGQPL
jgi:hypothetical protein